MSLTPLSARSLTESFLYTKITPCSICKAGSCAAAAPTLAEAGLVRIVVTCTNCGGSDALLFSVSALEAIDRTAHHVINPTEVPSVIIDLSQWVTLYTLACDRAGAMDSPADARLMHIRARECLDEALKFFPDDRNSPPLSAFFHARTGNVDERKQDRFTKIWLLELRSVLPTGDVVGSVDERDASTEGWWSWFWR